jgi:deazaflavin-dependent oxidoreductase (nitroreductase family)
MGLVTGFESAFMRLHQSLYVRTDGRVGHGMLVAVPSLLLRTAGRRSGVERTTALVYAGDGEDYVLVASNGARDVSPGWYFNLCADPRVEL